ncbi:hypothetical protein [Moraxella caviae]|nr:hypothetical protein [Moraxella caviae]
MNQLFSRLVGVHGMNAKSNALTPLLWLITSILIAMLLAIYIDAPKVIVHILIGVFAIAVAAFIHPAVKPRPLGRGYKAVCKP